MAFKVGVVGAGGAGRLLHLPALRELGDVEVVALCDARRERAEEVAKAFGVPGVFTDYRDLLREELDMVTIGLPNFLHAEVACAALEAGRHVVVEKPLAESMASARRMVECAERTGRHLFMAVQNRHRARVRMLRQMVLSGRMGEVYHIQCSILRRRGYPGMGSWFTNKELSGGGCLLDIGVHVLDMAWYIAAEPRPLRAVGMTYAKFGHLERKPSNFGDYDPEGVVDVDDFAAGFIVFEGGLSLALTVSWAMNNQQSGFQIRVFGTKAGASYDPFVIYSEDGGVVTDTTPLVRDDFSAYAAEFRHYVRVCQGKEEPCITPRAALTVQAMLEALYKSSEEGREVPVEP